MANGGKVHFHDEIQALGLWLELHKLQEEFESTPRKKALWNALSIICARGLLSPTLEEKAEFVAKKTWNFMNVSMGQVYWKIDYIDLSNVWEQEEYKKDIFT